MCGDMSILSSEPVVAGALAAIGETFLVGETGAVSIGGMRIPVSVACFGSVAASQYIAGIISDKVIAKMGQSSDVMGYENQLLTPGLAGAANVWALKMINPNVGALSSFALGAGSSILAQYGLKQWNSSA